jgi:hypothetical protein
MLFLKLNAENKKIIINEANIMEMSSFQKLMVAYLIENFSRITNFVAKEPEGSSPHSQQPATGPCPERIESNPHPPSQNP